MRVITFICFAVAAIVASPVATRYDLMTAAMNSLTGQVPFPRIVGREPSPVNAPPYLVSIQALTKKGWTHLCGGSILSTTKIVTAAHFAYLMAEYPTEWRIAAGKKNNLWIPENGEQYSNIASVAIHPGYCRGFNETDNDMAILEVSTPFTLNEFVNRIDLIESEPKDGDECVTSGWEIQTAERPFPLSSHIVPVVPRDTCASKYGNNPHITELEICAGDNGMRPCAGTGRPLVCNGALAGVASWTSLRHCGDSSLPTVFANVAALRDWIKGNL